MTARRHDVLADHELVELLAEEPQLLAIADAIAVTQGRPRRRLRPSRLLTVAAVVAAALAVSQLAPWQRNAAGAVLERALAAVGSGPVVQAVLEAPSPGSETVRIASGERAPVTIQIAYWFDAQRGRLRTVVSRGGSISQETLRLAGREVATAPGAPQPLAAGGPALDPALATFVTGYRRALATGSARVTGKGTFAGVPVRWLRLARERVAIDARSYRPLLIEPLDAAGRPGPFRWRVVELRATARTPAEFAPPKPAPVAPYRGDVIGSTPVSSLEARRLLGWRPLWLGEAFHGLHLVTSERQLLSRGYPPGSGRSATRGDGLRLRYGQGARFVELQEAPQAEPAYGWPGGRVTLDGNPIPASGSLELATGGAGGCVAQLRSRGLYLTVWASSRELCLAAARALAPIGKAAPR